MHGAPTIIKQYWCTRQIYVSISLMYTLMHGHLFVLERWCMDPHHHFQVTLTHWQMYAWFNWCMILPMHQSRTNSSTSHLCVSLTLPDASSIHFVTIFNGKLLPVIFYGFADFLQRIHSRFIGKWMQFLCQDNSTDTISIELMNGKD